MGEFSIVHGRIITNYPKEAKSFFMSMKEDKYFPCINPEMFNIDSLDNPDMYEHFVISFAATYSSVEDYLSEFILKFEHILKNIRFDSVKLQVETQLFNFDLFWGSKQERTDSYANTSMIECQNWFFGFGYRDMWGLLRPESYDPQSILGFSYPLKFDEKLIEGFNDIIEDLNNTKIGAIKNFDNYHSHPILGHDNVHFILTYLRLNGSINFNYSKDLGLCIERNKNIEKLKTPHNIS